jgi:hypothetical protein
LTARQPFEFFVDVVGDVFESGFVAAFTAVAGETKGHAKLRQAVGLIRRGYWRHIENLMK